MVLLNDSTKSSSKSTCEDDMASLLLGRKALMSAMVQEVCDVDVTIDVIRVSFH